MSAQEAPDFDKALATLKPYAEKIRQFGAHYTQSNMPFKEHIDATKLNLILQFNRILMEHFLAINELLNHPQFSGENYHAISICTISRAILEGAAQLFWVLKGTDDEVNKKVDCTRTLIKLYNALYSQSNKEPLTEDQIAIIKDNKDFCTNESHQKRWQDLTPEDIKLDNFCLLVAKRLDKTSDLKLPDLVSDFLSEWTEHNSPQVPYRYLSNFSHSNLLAMLSLFSLNTKENNGKKDFTLGFDNDDPEVIFHGLSIAAISYEYVLVALLKIMQESALLNELHKISGECRKALDELESRK